MSELSDLEITRKCAEAMGYKIRHHATDKMCWDTYDEIFGTYWPLTDDAQAMALVKRFQMDVDFCTDQWRASWYNVRGKDCTKWQQAVSDDMNRAICLCVARMKGATKGAEGGK